MEKMTRIRMTRNAHGSINGKTLHRFEEGVLYDVPDSLAQNFIISGYATAGRDRSGEEVLDLSEKSDAPEENKAIEPEENKAKPKATRKRTPRKKAE